MSASPLFNQLTKRLKALERHFLPRKWSPTGTYSEREMDRALAYRVLAHAEMEFFIEETIKNTLEQKIVEWKKTSKPSHILFCFLACVHSTWLDSLDKVSDKSSFPASKLSSSAKKSAAEVIDIAWKYYADIIQNNHGIRRRNLELLLPPIGLDLDNLDQSWIATIDAFGLHRGLAAHTSALTSKGVRRLFDPKTDRDTVNVILTGLEDFDKKVMVLKRL